MSHTKENEKICCPKFDPTPWENQEITWDNKMFIKDYVKSFFYMPLNFSSMMKRAWGKVEKADAQPDMKDWLMLSHDLSPWKSEHYLAVNKNVPDAENTTLSGTFLTKVFEGPYKNAGKWYKEMEEVAKSKNKKAKKVFLYYTTCPKCGKKWGKNYVVGFAQIN